MCGREQHHRLGGHFLALGALMCGCVLCLGESEWLRGSIRRCLTVFDRRVLCVLVCCVFVPDLVVGGHPLSVLKVRTVSADDHRSAAAGHAELCIRLAGVTARGMTNC